jgi:hypothetical protein
MINLQIILIPIDVTGNLVVDLLTDSPKRSRSPITSGFQLHIFKLQKRNPNLDCFYRLAKIHIIATFCDNHCSTLCSPVHKGL